MPVTLFLDVKTTFQGVECHNVFAYYSAALSGSAPLQTEAGEYFRDNVIPLWKDWTPQALAFNNIAVRSSNYPIPTDVALSGTGDVVAAASAILPAWLVAYYRANVSSNLVGDTGGVYSGMRPVRRGAKYFSAITEDFVGASGFDPTAGAKAAELQAFIESLNNPLVLTGGSAQAVVWGDAMDASGSKPARGVVVGIISTHSAVNITRLESRQQ